MTLTARRPAPTSLNEVLVFFALRGLRTRHDELSCAVATQQQQQPHLNCSPFDQGWLV